MLAERIQRARSTLVFVASRQLAERLTRFLNDGRDEQLAYAHHGSLAQDLRRAVEARLKAGEIPAVVATASLELGIDVGDCEQVLLVQTPASAICGNAPAPRARRTPPGSSYSRRGIYHPWA